MTPGRAAPPKTVLITLYFHLVVYMNFCPSNIALTYLWPNVVVRIQKDAHDLLKYGLSKFLLRFLYKYLVSVPELVLQSPLSIPSCDILLSKLYGIYSHKYCGSFFDSSAYFIETLYAKIVKLNRAA